MDNSKILRKCKECRDSRTKVSREIFERKIKSDSLCQFCEKEIDPTKQYKSFFALWDNEYVKCEVCHIIMKKQNLTSHMRRHNNSEQRKCFMCHRTYSSMWSLSEHIIAVHGKLSRFPCSYCERIFTGASNRNKHENSVHKKLPPTIKTTVCSICKREIGTYYLKRHMAEIHSVRKIYVCEFCDESFSTSRELRDHRRAIMLLLPA